MIHPKILNRIIEADAAEFMRQLPDNCANLIVTSPPYNLGKPYDDKKPLAQYLELQRSVIREAWRVLANDGHICWQVGNQVKNGSIMPLDILLHPIFEQLGFVLRNRIIWHFGHGLHAKKRFSGRYEVIMWYSKSGQYHFDLDAVRIPQKYPNKKAYKGERKGQLSGNPLGKNPSDIWPMPNVKSNHVEKTDHPCQYPVALIQRLIKALTEPDDIVIDPFIGSGTTAIAAILEKRNYLGCDNSTEFVDLANARCDQARDGSIKIRPLNKPIYEVQS